MEYIPVFTSTFGTNAFRIQNDVLWCWFWVNGENGSSKTVLPTIPRLMLKKHFNV